MEGRAFQEGSEGVARVRRDPAAQAAHKVVVPRKKGLLRRLAGTVLLNEGVHAKFVSVVGCEHDRDPGEWSSVRVVTGIGGPDEPPVSRKLSARTKCGRRLTEITYTLEM